MSSKATATKERDAMKAQLAAMMSSTKAPGSEQADRVVQKKEEPISEAKLEPKAPAKKKTGAKQPAKTGSPVKPEPKVKLKRGGEERAEKVSVSLHPTDQDNAELIENALRAAGLITRRAPTSFLLKVALASFDANKIDNLEEVIASIKARDGRGKWMQEMAGRE